MEQHNAKSRNTEPQPPIPVGEPLHPTPIEPLQQPTQLSLPTPEITHTFQTQRFTMRLTEKDGRFIGLEVDALKDGKPLITYSRLGFFGTSDSEFFRALVGMEMRRIPPAYLIQLGSKLTHISAGSWSQRLHGAPGHDASLLLTIPPILPTLAELFGTWDVTKEITFLERITQGGSALLLARCSPRLGTLQLLISETDLSNDDPLVRTFTICTPMTATTNISDVSAWQSERLKTLCGLFTHLGTEDLFQHLCSQSTDTVEIASSPTLRIAMENKLANWEYTPEYATTTWDHKEDMYVTTHIGIRHALIAVRYDESTTFPSVWIQFKTPDNQAIFSSSQWQFLNSLAPMLTSSDDMVKHEAINWIASPLRSIGIIQGDSYQISPDCLAPLQLDSLRMETSIPRPNLREIGGAEIDTAFSHIPRLLFAHHDVSKQQRIRLDLLGQRSFYIHFDTASPGGHIPDLFRTARFLFCPDGSFHVELHNSLGGISRGFVKTDRDSRSSAFLGLCRTLSDQGVSGWVPVEQTLRELENMNDSYNSEVYYDTEGSMLPPIDDHEGARMYSAAARIVNDLRDITDFKLAAEVHPSGPGECTVIINTNAMHPELHLQLSNGAVTSCSSWMKRVVVQGSPQRHELWRVYGQSIPLTSIDCGNLLQQLGRYFKERDAAYFPDSMVLDSKRRDLHPELVRVQELFEGW